MARSPLLGMHHAVVHSLLFAMIPLSSAFLVAPHLPRLSSSISPIGHSTVETSQALRLRNGVGLRGSAQATRLQMSEGSGEDAKLEAARKAAQAAELGLMGGDLDKIMEDKEKKQQIANKQAIAAQQAAAQEERQSKFETDMKQVVAGQGFNKDGLDNRGVRLDDGDEAGALDGDEEGALDDSLIQKVLKGEKTESIKKKKQKQKQKEKLRTETGEELYMTEMAPGAEVSKWAAPEGGFDPMNPPLPSELKKKQEEEASPEDAMPLPSELASPSQQRLYSAETAGIEDDALFTIKSVLDSRPMADPTKKAPPAEDKAVPLGRADIGSLDDIIARDRAALKSTPKVSDRPLVELDAAGALDEAGESLAEVVNRVLGLVVVADFFVVLGFLGWLGLSIVYQFAFCGGLTKEGGPICANPLYDTWYSLWTPVIQPALGILMGSIIVQGTVNGLRGKKEGEE